MSCKYSAEWWQKYETMTATSNSEKAEPARISDVVERPARPHGGKAGDRDCVVRGSGAVWSAERLHFDSVE
jgi:hypothetical protein